MRDVLLEKYPDSIDDCPKPESINEEKAKHAVITGDNCNSAHKQKRLTNERLGGKRMKWTASEYVKVPICIFCTHFFVLLSPKSNTLTQ